MKKIAIAAAAAFLVSCGGNNDSDVTSQSTEPSLIDDGNTLDISSESEGSEDLLRADFTFCADTPPYNDKQGFMFNNLTKEVDASSPCELDLQASEPMELPLASALPIVDVCCDRILAIGDRAFVPGNFAFDDPDDPPNTRTYSPSLFFDVDSQGAWSYTGNLPTPDVASSAVATDGNRIVTSDLASNKVSVYERDNTGQWNRIELNPNDELQLGTFGTSLAIEGNRLVVGSAFNGFVRPFGIPSFFTNFERGDESLYVFELNENNEWKQTAKIVTSDFSPDRDTAFGNNIDLYQDRIVAVAPSRGSASVWPIGVLYIFDIDSSGNWIETKITPGSTDSFNQFSGAVSTHGDFIAVGAASAKKIGLGETESLVNPGMVYLYKRNQQANWIETQLQPSDIPNTIDHELAFGQFIKLTADKLIIGAPGEPAVGVLASSVYLYSLDDSVVSETIVRFVDSSDVHFSFGYDQNRLMVPRFNAFGTIGNPGTIQVFEIN